MPFKPVYFLVASLILLITSCGPSRNLVYFSNLTEHAEYLEKVTNIPDSKIQPDDLLNITVTSLNPESIALFNGNVSSSVSNVNSSANSEGYLVNREGVIDYPVLGRVKLGGLTKAEAKDKLEADLNRYLKEPIVRIRYLNYKITVVGEVNNPSTFTVPSEKINIIEALGLAGDMTVYGKRENVLIIREEEGIRKITRLNLNNKEVLNSPYFYLQQNDIVYVEPDKAKAVQASLSRSNISLGLSIVVGAASLISILLNFL
jgi:polysaccharide export outer membrane protein